MFIANFTPDTIEWTHVGQSGKLETDDILEFDDARGKHILNKWGKRGLIRVSYEDKGNEDELREKSMKQYREFWEGQVNYFNTQNMQRENENKPFVAPSKVLEEKAKELNLGLKSPWVVQPQPDPSAGDRRVTALESELDEMKGMMKDILGTVTEVSKQRDDALIAQFSGKNDIDFRAFVLNNLDKIHNWPEGVQAVVQAQWASTQGGENYPLS